MLEQEFDFTLILSGIDEITDQLFDEIEARFVQSGCDDGMFSYSRNKMQVTFCRTALSLEDALRKAIGDVQRADFVVSEASIRSSSLPRPELV